MHSKPLNEILQVGRILQVYSKAVPGSMTEEQFIADLNASTLRLAGLQDEAPESVLGYGDGSHR